MMRALEKGKLQPFLFMFVLACGASAWPKAEPVALLWSRGRLLFYQSVENQAKIDSAIAVFQEISAVEPGLAGRAQTYIGSLTALRAKFAPWPQDKLKFANEGLRLMDQGLARDSLDVESLFVHGSTCYFLPVFFGRADDAQRNLRAIVQLLPVTSNQYDPDIVTNVVEFISEKIRLSKKEKAALQQIPRKPVHR
jgi:hypothetical protein